MNKIYDNAIELGERIRKARENANLSQYNLHDLTDISVTQISAYENGKRNIGLQSLYKIARATGKTMDELYEGKKENEPINKAKNKGELIVNCIAAVVDENVITSLPHNHENKYVANGCEYIYRIGFSNYVGLLDKLVAKLIDFKKLKNNYPDPNIFKKQILAAYAKQINSKK